MYLDGYRVLDLTEECGLLCGQLLGDLGADVVHVEPPGGSSARRDDVLWRVHTRNQLSVVVDQESVDGRRRFDDLLRDCDVLVESAGLDHGSLHGINPSLVHVSITPFGCTGPKRSYVATDLIVQAASGAMAVNGYADRPPIRTGGITAWSHAGAAAAGAALLALRWRNRTGRPTHVDVSAQEATSLTAAFTFLTEAIGSVPTPRSDPNPPVQFVWACADGFVSNIFFLAGPTRHFAVNQLRWMVGEGECEPDLLAAVEADALAPDQMPVIEAAITASLLRRTKVELMAAALAHRFLLTPVNTTADVLESDQLQTRDAWWRDGDLVMPGPFARFQEPLRLRRPAPTLDEQRVVGFTGARPPRSTAIRPGVAPLDDVHVLDFGWVMAGPWATRVLADYGATVVKVESATRLDLLRLLGPYYPDAEPLENSASFASVAAGKRSLGLDLSNPAARDVVFDLVDWADVVCEAFAPGAMERWDLGYDVLRARKPSIIMASSCLFGQTGPLHSVAGYGTQGVAVSGLQHGTGWKDRPPIGPFGPFTDFVAPRFLLLALLAALDHRDRTGDGQYIDLAQSESSLQVAAETIGRSSLDGSFPDREDNHDRRMSPHGVYRCQGDDSWVAIAVRDNADWRRLCAVIGRPDLGGGRLCDVGARRAACREIDAAISAWTEPRAATECEARLQELGVPAHHVLTGPSAAADPHVQARGMFAPTSRGGTGAIVASSGYHFSSFAAAVGPAPTLGGDTTDILRDALGYADSKIDRLLADGVITQGKV